MRVLVIEDDSSMAKSLELILAAEGIASCAASHGEEGLDLGRVYDHDLIILDLNLPGLHGFEVLKRLRSARIDTPILILSGLSQPDDRVKGLTLGADDFLTKPFDKRELIARIRAVVRRSNGHSQSIIRTGKLTVDLDAGAVEVNGRSVPLTDTEYRIMELLSLRKEMTLTKEMFLDHLYGGLDEPHVTIIDVFICKLRKKLAMATGGEHYIHTVWGRGYVLSDQDGLISGRPA